MESNVFDILGFSWNRSKTFTFQTHSLDRVLFRYYKSLPEFVWDASVLERNPFTFPEIKTLMDGITVGGRKLSDQEQILNLISSSKELLNLVKKAEFSLTKECFCSLHDLVARNEALEWGRFRGEGQETSFSPGVSLGTYGRYEPLPTIPGAHVLNSVFEQAGQVFKTQFTNPVECAFAFFLHGALQQYFFDGNKRTSRLMMSGILLSNGVDAVSIPASRVTEFNEKMTRFYALKDATEMMQFLSECHPDVVMTKVSTLVENCSR